MALIVKNEPYDTSSIGNSMMNQIYDVITNYDIIIIKNGFGSKNEPYDTSFDWKFYNESNEINDGDCKIFEKIPKICAETRTSLLHVALGQH